MAQINLPPQFTVVIPIVAGVGNALMALPMVRQLKTRAGAGRIVIVARIDAMAEPFRRVAEVDEVIVARGTKKMIATLRASRADLLVVPFPSNRWQYAMLALASGARQKLLHNYPIGYFRAMHFVGTRVPAERGIHDVEQNLRLLRAIGSKPDFSESPVFSLNDADQKKADEILAGTRDFIAIHAGSAKTILAEAKRWPSEKYAKLIGRLHGEFDRTIVLLEGPDEMGVADVILSDLPRDIRRPMVIKLAGNLGTAAAVLARAAIYVGSDSGLAHLAAAVGIRTITLFAPADPDRVAPHGNRSLVVQPMKNCTPCFLYPWKSTYPKMCCGKDGKPMCITEISVDQVMQRVHDGLPTNRIAAREQVS